MIQVNNKIIEIKNIKAFIGQTKVFEDLSLEIEYGCNTVILGPNGSGKTTLLKLLTKELFPVYNEESYIKISGKENWNVWDLRSHIGLVSGSLDDFIYYSAPGINVILSGLFASPDVWEYQTVEPEQKSAAEEIIKLLGVEELRDRAFGKMSSGQQRKFLLGRALINNPDVLILDEPTSGLDIKACLQYIDIIRKLMKSGKTIILVTHHIHEIPPEMNRVILLKKGIIAADGEKEQILTDSLISDLFDVPLRIIKLDGFYQVLPGNKEQ